MRLDTVSPGTAWTGEMKIGQSVSQTVNQSVKSDTWDVKGEDFPWKCCFLFYGYDTGEDDCDTGMFTGY